MAGPTLNDLNNRLRELEAQLIGAMEDLAREVALNAKAYAERIIVERGFGAEYSSKKYPAFFLYGRELNNKGLKFLEQRGVDKATGKQGKAKKKRRKKGETGDPGSYDTMTNWGEFREGQGLQNEFVDLHYSNKMFAGMTVQEVLKVGDIYTAVLGGNSKEVQDKMNWNYERYGNFFDKALGEDGRQFIAELAMSRIRQIMANFFTTQIN